MKKAEVRIETFVGAGRYQHRVINWANGDMISNEIVELQKKVNESIYDEMPENSRGLTSIIKYKFPKD